MQGAGSIRFTVEFTVGRGQLRAFRAMANDLFAVVEAHEPRARAKLTRWVADGRARRVPTFVIRMTGLDTKKQVVARYGENALFEKGKRAPRSRTPPRAGAPGRAAGGE